MIKWNRYYKLVFYYPEVDTETHTLKKEAKSLTIESPLKCEFDINRNTFATSNTANFKIYDLNLANRNIIFQDQYNIGRQCFVDFYAGYYNEQSQEVPLLFSGAVRYAYSNHNGTDNITEIECFDYDLDSYSSTTFEAGTTRKEVVLQLANDLPNVTVGSIGDIQGTFNRPYVVNDNTFKAIQEVTGDSSFVDNGEIHVLQNNEVQGDYSIYKLDSSSGLLGTPRRSDASLECDCIFAPEITVGQLLEIESVTAPTQFNGQYKVLGIHHKGVISGAESGTATTTLSLFVGAFLPNSNFAFAPIDTTGVMEVKGDKISAIKNIKTNADVQSVLRYLRKYGKPPHEKITKDIWWSDALYKYSEQKIIPTLQVLSNLVGVATRLQAFHDTYYPSAKFVITSGWRAPAYNASKGGSATSNHIYGRALDWNFKGYRAVSIWSKFNAFWSGEKILYTKGGNNFIHGAIDFNANITGDK